MNGDRLSNKREHEKALAYFLIAVRAEPSCAATYNNLGTAYFQLDRHTEALSEYEAALKFKPSWAWVIHYNIGRSFMSLGQFEEAAKSYDEAIRLNPKDAAPYRGRARVHIRLGQFEDAVRSYGEAIRRNSKDAASYRGRAGVNIQMGRGIQAVADAEKLLKIKGWREKDSIYAVILAFFGLSQADNKQPARDMLDQAASKGKRSDWPYPIIRYLRDEINEQELLSLANDPGQITVARTYIGMRLILSGKKDEAREHLEWVKENGKKNFWEYDFAISELKRID